MNENKMTEQEAADAYNTCLPELRRYLKKLVGDEGAAEDLAQEAGLRLIRFSRSEFIREPRAWLFHAAANLAKDVLRRRLTAESAGQTLFQEQTHHNPTPDEQAHSQQQLKALSQAVDKLPKQARRILLMARVDGLSYKEIARQLAITPKTVENHLARAISRLSELFGGRSGLQ